MCSAFVSVRLRPAATPVCRWSPVLRQAELMGGGAALHSRRRCGGGGCGVGQPAAISGARGARSLPGVEARQQTTHGQASWAGLEGNERVPSPYLSERSLFRSAGSRASPQSHLGRRVCCPSSLGRFASVVGWPVGHPIFQSWAANVPRLFFGKVCKCCGVAFGPLHFLLWGGQ